MDPKKRIDYWENQAELYYGARETQGTPEIPIEGEMFDEIVERLRPALGRSTKVTPSGRAKITSGPQEITNRTKPKVKWYLLEYLVRHTPNTNRHWPVIIPGCLELLDQTEIDEKLRGVGLVMFLSTNSHDQLEKTGLIKVFQDAISPLLTYLPPSVEARETAKLIGPVTQVLLSLSSEPRAMHSVIRDGPLRALKHTGGDLLLLKECFQSMTKCINILESRCIPHFGEIISSMRAISTDPFTVLNQELVEASDEVLVALLKYGWPRAEYYRFDLLFIVERLNLEVSSNYLRALDINAE